MVVAFTLVVGEYAEGVGDRRCLVYRDGRPLNVGNEFIFGQGFAQHVVLLEGAALVLVEADLEGLVLVHVLPQEVLVEGVRG